MSTDTNLVETPKTETTEEAGLSLTAKIGIGIGVVAAFGLAYLGISYFGGGSTSPETSAE